jgi:hypothetical protein
MAPFDLQLPLLLEPVGEFTILGAQGRMCLAGSKPLGRFSPQAHLGRIKASHTAGPHMQPEAGP